MHFRLFISVNTSCTLSTHRTHHKPHTNTSLLLYPRTIKRNVHGHWYNRVIIVIGVDFDVRKVDMDNGLDIDEIILLSTLSQFTFLFSLVRSFYSVVVVVGAVTVSVALFSPFVYKKNFFVAFLSRCVCVCVSVRLYKFFSSCV